jgi:hypothetical protein
MMGHRSVYSAVQIAIQGDRIQAPAVLNPWLKELIATDPLAVADAATPQFQRALLSSQQRLEPFWASHYCFYRSSSPIPGASEKIKNQTLGNN